MGKQDSRSPSNGEESVSSGAERKGKRRATGSGSASSSAASSSSSSPLLLLCVSLQQLQQAVLQQDDRPITRMLRQLKSLRTKVPARLLALAADNLLWKLAPDVVPPATSTAISADVESKLDATMTTSPATDATGFPVVPADSPVPVTVPADGEVATRGTMETSRLSGGGGAPGSQQPQQLLRVTLDAETQDFWKAMRAHLDAAVIAEEQSKTDKEMDVDAEDTSVTDTLKAKGGPSVVFPLRAVDFLCCSGEVETFLCLLLLLRLLDARQYAAAARVGDILVNHVIFIEERGVCEDPVAVLLPEAPAAAAPTTGKEHQGQQTEGGGVIPTTSSSKAPSNHSKNSEPAAGPSSVLIQQLQQQGAPRRRRRRLDLIAAKCVFFWYRARELEKSLDQCVRRDLLKAYTVASVQHDRMMQATTLNLLLRDYIALQQYELAVKLVAKTAFPEHLRSNAQHARYLYYLGSIQAVRLEYSAAFSKLQMALRRAPQQPRLAAGFRLAVLKKAIVVELLMGDIPERVTFNRKETRAALFPYKHIVLAVRSGDLHAFGEVMRKYEKVFTRDGTLCLIRRLHHNVIRAGLRLISLSYSRIPLADVAQKLGLESAAYAEGIVAKAILDGVIEATIDHEKQCIESRVNPAVYTSTEPQKAFNKRIAFCLQLHADAVRAMQYPEAEDAREKKDDDADERRKALREELARVEDEDIGDDEMDLF